MNSSETDSQPTILPNHSDATADESGSSVSTNPMDEYYQLKKSIFFVTLATTGIIFLLVYLTYSLAIALSYLIGACVGIMYLRMLAKDVEKISGNNPRVGSGRLALFAGLIIIATQWDQIQVLPAFLGFLTYKIAILFYVLPNSLLTAQKSE